MDEYERRWHQRFWRRAIIMDVVLFVACAAIAGVTSRPPYSPYVWMDALVIALNLACCVRCGLDAQRAWRNYKVFRDAGQNRR